jgi:hypothetical protein
MNGCIAGKRPVNPTCPFVPRPATLRRFRLPGRAFQALGLIPTARRATVVETTITFNYTTILNLVFLVLAGVLVYRFFRTGGPAMLRMMDLMPEEMQGMDHGAMAHGHAGGAHTT